MRNLTTGVYTKYSKDSATVEIINDIKIKNNKQVLALFFIHPFASFLLAVINLKAKYSLTIIFLFFVLFGLTFIAQNQSADSYRYVKEFNSYKNATTTKYITDIKEFFTFDTDIKDIYTISTYYLVSRITDNYHILLALWAAVFSYFFLKAFRFFVDRPEFQKSLIIGLLAFLFIFSNNIFNINGVRFYTAAWIAVYAFFEIVVNKKLQFLLLVAIIPLFHIAYFTIWGVLLLYLFSLKYDKFWVTIFIISFFVSNMSVELIQKYSYLGPTAGQYMANSYASDDNVASKLELIVAIPLYAKVLIALPRLFINALIFIFIWKLKIVKSNTIGYSVFLFLLVWMSFVNFTWSVPSFGIRFITLSIPFICYICLIFYREISLLRKFIYLVPIIYCYAIFQWFRVMVTVTDPYLIFSFFPHLVLKNLF